MFMACLL